MSKLETGSSDKRTRKLVWKSYRDIRRDLLALESLEEHLGANLYQIGERTTKSTLSPLDVVFLDQSFKTLRDISAGLVESITLIERSTSNAVIEDINRLREGIDEHLPGISSETVDVLVRSLQDQGGMRKWFALMRNTFKTKLHTYGLCATTIRRAIDLPDPSILSSIERILVIHHEVLPTLHISSVLTDTTTNEENFKRLLRESIEKGKKELYDGKPSFIAAASFNSLTTGICVTNPKIAAELGIFCHTSKPQASLLCLFPAGPSLAFCVLVVLIAVSSHNVE